MNSTDEGAAKANLPSTSRNSDRNANLSMTTDESKGAIPKSKPKVAPKKTNNNPDDVETFSGDIIKRNGYSKHTPNNYLNNAYAESDSDSERLSVSKGAQRPPVNDLKRTPFTIPLEDGFLNMSFVPLNNSSSSFVDVNKKGCCKYREQREDGSSSDDNELLSVSDDGCIYTYKGDHAADLPSSFFKLEIPPFEEVAVDCREENSSPEMDFLEMDFDPGPSGDADSDSISNTEIDTAACLPLDAPSEQVIEEPKPCCSKDSNIDPAPSNENFHRYLNLSNIHKEPAKIPIVPKCEIKMPWSCSMHERTRSSKLLRTIKRHQSSKGLLSPNETFSDGDITVSSLNAFYNSNDRNLTDETSSDVEKVMIWSDQDAFLKQRTQVGPSACGATAVLNVLSALRFPVPTVEHVQECVNTRLRANSSPLDEYLISRSDAGCTHRDLITALYKASDKRVYSRFFAMYPERIVNLERWLGYWMKNGAVPIATLNLQKCERPIPDSWHHQMIFGVGPKGIYMANPLECVDPSQLWPQLSSESVLLVRTEDVMSRWNPSTSWKQLLNINDVRWKKLNVVGQVARVVRERRRNPRCDHVITSHIKIPAEYSAGITLAIDINAPAFTLLRQCPELPLLYPEDAASAF